ncbi:MAG: PEP-CTERM sorting domain-containing protein [Planctomycetia bacterium]|nr:PEP-CTERM sorting domain-containing protein [Planctomycetia bacterium]
MGSVAIILVAGLLWSSFFGFCQIVSAQLPTNEGNFLNTLSPNVHLDASNSSSIEKDESTGNVSKWKDTSGKNYVYSQSTPGNQPSMGTIEIGENNFPALIFSTDSSATRGGDYLTSSASLINYQTIFIVADVESAAWNRGIFGHSGGDVGIRIAYENLGGGNYGDPYWTMAGWTTSGTMTFNGSAHPDAGTTQDIFAPHLLMGGTQSPQQITATLGSYFEWPYGSEAPRPYDGKIAEVLTFSGTLTSVETKLVNTYFYAKYGLDIAEGNRFGITFSPTYQKDFFAVMNDDYVRNSYGTGGFGVGVSGGGTLADGTALFVTSNHNSEVQLVESVTTTGETIFAWDKEWLLQNLSTEAAQASMIDLAFNFEDALFLSAEEGSEWALLFRDDTSEAYQRLSNFVAWEGEGSDILFSLQLSDLQTGLYTIGWNQGNSVPEPTTWGMLLAGLACFWVMKRKVAKK